MSDNVTDLDKTHESEAAPEISSKSPIPSEESMLFQLFFLDCDQKQSEVVKTGERDLGRLVSD